MSSALAVSLLFLSPALAPAQPQVVLLSDNFEDGTLDGWLTFFGDGTRQTPDPAIWTVIDGKACQTGFEREHGLLGTEAMFSGPEFTFSVDVSFSSTPTGIAILPRAGRFTAFAIQYLVSPPVVGAAIVQFSSGVVVGSEGVALQSIPTRIGFSVTPSAVSLLADDEIALSVPNLIGDIAGGIFVGEGGGLGGFPVCFDNVLLTVPTSVVEVKVDIKPGSDPNSLSLNSKGVVPVAILTTAGFDATTVNPGSAVFAGASAVHSALEDVDADGDLDMILHFPAQDTNLVVTDTAACLAAETFGGTQVRGCDSVKLVP